MSLRLNQAQEAFKEFYGRNVQRMPELMAEGRVPLSVNGLMQRRLDVRNADEDIKTSWMDHYFDTGDAVVYHPDGRGKIVLDSQYLREMTPGTQRSGGALILTPEQYDAMDGEEFKKGKLGEIGAWMSKKDVKDHPVWKALARDQVLLDDYTDLIFAEGKERFGIGWKSTYDNAMGVYTTSTNGDTPEMRVWCVDGLDGGSDVSGRRDLDLGGGRLVGVAPEALSAKISGIGSGKGYTRADVRDAVYELEELEKLVRPEALNKVKSLVKKL
jgi:hypothetical protein